MIELLRLILHIIASFLCRERSHGRNPNPSLTAHRASQTGIEATTTQQYRSLSVRLALSPWQNPYVERLIGTMEPPGGHRQDQVHPDERWMQQIARNVTMESCGALRDCRYLLHDRDTNY